MRRLVSLAALLALGACASPGLDRHDFALGPDPSEGRACAERSMPDLGGPDPVAGFGCATEANLRAMLANPEELHRPATPTPPSGDAAFEAARRHRTGTEKPLPVSEAGAAPALILRDTTGGS